MEHTVTISVGNRCGNSDDDRDWTHLKRIFIDDVTFDMTDRSVPICERLTDIRRFTDREGRPRKILSTRKIFVSDADAGVQLDFRIVGDSGRSAGGGFQACIDCVAKIGANIDIDIDIDFAYTKDWTEHGRQHLATHQY
jgi:hypothetical protein